jgi:hypothetical protein
MRGTAYAIGEIIAFLVLAGLVGLGIGLLIGWSRQWTSAGKPAPPVDTAAAARAKQLEARVRELEAAQASSGESAQRIEALQKELSVAQWQIEALEEELGKQDTPADSG